MDPHQVPPPYQVSPGGPQGEKMPIPVHSGQDSKQIIPGYENVSETEGGLVAPPTAPEWNLDNPPEREAIGELPALSEEEVREAVMQYVNERCCYGSGTAREMQMHDIKMKSAFHYTFQTFSETRETKWAYVPYVGQFVDGPQNGRAPGPWEILAAPDSNFSDSVKAMEIPHTAFVRTCHKCYGSGKVTCSRCMGRGSVTSTSNNTTRTSTCFTCNGTGRVKCEECDGRGSLKCFVQLTITWKNHHENYISDTCSMPKEKLLDVTGKFVFQEENDRVWPIMHSGDKSVDEASKFLVQKHSREFSMEKILQQRHALRTVPLAEVHYTWKNNQGTFYVYGFENKVYFDKYPQRCCCLCTIL